MHVTVTCLSINRKCVWAAKCVMTCTCRMEEADFKASETTFSDYDITSWDFQLMIFFFLCQNNCVPSQNRCILLATLFQFAVTARNQEITEKFPALIIHFVSHHFTVHFPPHVVMLQRASVHILQCQTAVTQAHMMRIGTIKELTTVTHDHNLLIWVCITWDCIASHVLYQLLHMCFMK